jgi:hypothetical protein
VYHAVEIEPHVIGCLDAQLVEYRILPPVPIRDHQPPALLQIPFHRVEHRRPPLEMMIRVQHR